MKRTLLILGLVLILLPAPVLGKGVTVLVGAQSVSFGADMGKYYNIPPGPGITALIGLDLGIPVDFRIGKRETKDDSSGEDVTYEWMEFGPRFRLGKEDATIRADWFLGVGSYSLKIGSLEYDDALGAFAGVGIEETIGEKYVGRFEIKSALWKSDTFSTDGASLNMSLLFGFTF